MQVPVLNTARLRLRPYHLEDAQAVFTMLTGNDLIAEHLHTPAHASPEQTRLWISQILMRDEDPGVAYWLIEETDTHHIIGSISLLFHPAYDMYTLGFIIAPVHWGQGYATEAADAIVRYAFDSLALPSLLGFHKAENPASGAVLRKAGFHYWQDIISCTGQRMPAYLCEQYAPD